MRIVKFENRRAVPRGFRVGVEMDNNVAQVQFELPHIADNQIETLFWRFDNPDKEKRRIMVAAELVVRESTAR